ncbi:MAG: hypothetical protein KAU02_03640, partial [Tenericutes bacterium]|nr:hypothetical protein [Mycoplasmatota bacterium]
MKVTANILLNYIRCRRYASLNDPNSDYEYQDFEVNSRNYYHEYLELFKQIYQEELLFKDENRHLFYE